jgi:PPOX class probable F420-dependent enzyme
VGFYAHYLYTGDSMFDDKLRAFLTKPRIARLATLDPDGYPHVVPIWFGVEGDDILFMSDRETAKVRNALNHPKGAVTIGGDKGDEAGYLIRGDLSIYDDVGHQIAHQLLYHYESKARADELAADWANDDIVVIRLTPTKIIKVH